MNDSKEPEKEIVLGGDEPVAAPSVDQQLNAMSRESKVYLGGHTTQEQFVPSKLNVQKSGTGRMVLLVVTGILLVAALAVAAWSFIERARVAAELENTKTQLAEAQTTTNRYKLAAENLAASATPGSEPAPVTFQSFITQYAELTSGSGSATSEAGRDYTLTAADKTAIETAVKSYYKISELPEGWAALGARKDPAGAVHALVYWPESVSKQAGFMVITKSTSGFWKYNEQP